ncbi:MAG: hypothetical protein HWD61_06195 [Parachlamydiaceae bacterium]|nr:MAG: hypothetical protein HWD61_06195 [Parachlamydiaceae bacterium]
MEFTTLSNAVSAYQQKHQNDLDFQKLGAGSFGSWKVTVLLHNQKDNTWKFEDANIFQRVFWKIAKYIPFLKPTYEKVNLDKIHAALKNETDPKATILMGRIEQLWQMKMKGVQPKEALETIKQQAASLKTSVKDQQVSASEDKKAAASKFEDTDKTEGMEIEKNPPLVNYLRIMNGQFLKKQK